MERYIRNPHGITIRCCCATCQHKTLDLDDRARNSEILAWVALVVSVVSLIAIALLKLLR